KICSALPVFTPIPAAPASRGNVRRLWSSSTPTAARDSRSTLACASAVDSAAAPATRSTACVCCFVPNTAAARSTIRSSSAATDGNKTGWQAFWTTANQLRTAADAGQTSTVNALYQQLLGNNPDGTRNPAYPVYLDPNALIDYMMVNFFVGNLDGPSVPNNFY